MDATVLKFKQASQSPGGLLKLRELGLTLRGRGLMTCICIESHEKLVLQVWEHNFLFFFFDPIVQLVES